MEPKGERTVESFDMKDEHFLGVGDMLGDVGGV